MSQPEQATEQKAQVGLVLSGGGARGAYQAGVLKAIGEISGSMGLPSPIHNVTGVSAGAINAAYVAAGSDNWARCTDHLCDLWRSLTADQVFKTDAFSAGRAGLRLLSDATFGALYKRKLARSLLDTEPLRNLLSEIIPFQEIDRHINEGHLNALAISAMNYSNASSITFVQGAPGLSMWERARRASVRAKVSIEHIMASAAIPLFFPPVQVGDTHYGDGCLRNTAPLSPAIHLGSQRLIVVSVRRPDALAVHERGGVEPTIARVLGVIMNALLLDAIEVDMERMSRVNETVGRLPEAIKSHLALRKVEYLWIRPSQDIGHMAAGRFDHLPKVIRYLMGGLGSSAESAEITSYLLFEPEFCGKLIDLGYHDGMAHAEEIKRFLSV